MHKIGLTLIATGLFFGNVGRWINYSLLYNVSVIAIWIGVLILFLGDSLKKSFKPSKVQGKNEVANQFYNPIATDKTFLENLDKLNLKKDQFDNLAGNDFDLAKDGSFTGYTIAVLQLYVEKAFDFKLPQSALEEKGFKIHRWAGTVPAIGDFKDILSKSCQLWIISDRVQKLGHEHLQVIKEFFDQRKGVYIWGDNDPYYKDANQVGTYLFQTTMYGDVPGGKVISAQKEHGKIGLIKSHIISTGVDSLYEGGTIATIQSKDYFTPLLFGSANNLVVAVYDRDGKRAIMDGGFTRLFCNWDSAGTGRYVKNAAAFLANIENK